MKEEYNKKDAVSRVSGNLYRFGDNAQLFEPTGKGEPTFTEQRRYKNGVTVSTTRGNTPTKIVKLKVPGDSPDLYWDCVNLLKESIPSEKNMRKEAVGRQWQTLFNGDDWAARLNHKSGQLVVTYVIDLKKKPIYRDELFKMQHQIYNELCSPTNEQSLTSAVRALQRAGSSK